LKANKIEVAAVSASHVIPKLGCQDTVARYCNGG